MAGYSVTFSVVDNATKQIDAINRRMAAMHAPMDRLSKQVSRFVDVSGLRTIEKGFTAIASSAGKVLRTLVEIVPAMGAITGAASIAGMAKLVSSYASWSQQLVTTADSMGMTTQQVQQFEDATRLAGGKVEDMDASMKGLYKTVTDMKRTGGTADVIATGWANKLKININDANGHIRTMSSLLPEVVQKIAAIQNPADRAAAATHLLGDRGMQLVETFRRSHQSFLQWMTDASRYTDLTDQQKDQLQSFSEAQGHVATAFDHLGQQVAAVMANNFTPFLNKLAEFVKTHQPQIIAAVDAISKKFTAWLENPATFKSMEAGLNSLVKTLGFIADHLDAIKTTAEIVAGIFITLWGVKVINTLVEFGKNLTGIAATCKNIQTCASGAGGGAAGGAGEGIDTSSLLRGAATYGGLALNAANEARAQANMTPDEVRKRQEANVSSIMSLPVIKQLGEAGNWMRDKTQWARPWERGGAAPAPGSSGGGWGGDKSRLNSWDRSAAPGPMNLPTGNVARGAAIRDRLAKDLGLTGAQASGIVGNLEAESGLKAVQEKNPIAGRGGFGWAQWTGPRRVQFENYAKAHGLDPKSDEANYGFLLQELKQGQYKGMLDKMRQQQGASAAYSSAGIFEAGFERPAVSNAGTRGKYAEQYAAAAAPVPPMQLAQAAPAALPPPTANVNGAVDVNITGKNLPPDSSVTAKGSGAVKVPPPKVEYQNFATV